MTDDQALWRALQPLRSTSVFLMLGAHPDDEWNGFLAWLAYGLGVRTVYACSTRGEGGQNALGPERGRALAALRSREMEQAAAEIDLALRWLGAGVADDPIHDFGFSKSGTDTLHRWGAERLVERLVRLIRTERPDAMSPTFLDVPGQHGHHRAMTWAMHAAFARAADPAVATGQPPWQVAKLYLPAFGGGGGSYDDAEPPPPETVRVDLGARCAPLGASWAQLGERSRRWHASQGMGRDVPDGPRPFALHLVAGPADRDAPMDGVVRRLGDIDPAWQPADAAIDAALAAFPDRAGVADALHAALAVLTGADEPRAVLKRRQLGRAAALALGVSGSLVLEGVLRVGGPLNVFGPALLRLPPGWSPGAPIPADAVPFGTLRDQWEPTGGNDVLGATLRWTHAGSEGACEIDPPSPLSLAPAIEVSVTPVAVVRRMDSAQPVRLDLQGAAPPASWPVGATVGDLVEIEAPPGLLVLPSAGLRLQRVGPAALPVPASARVLRADIAIDAGARVGVVAGPVDGTLAWLRQLDIAAEAIDDATLAGDLSRFNVILIGIFAFGQRPALATAMPHLRRWMAQGGALVTLYHRPQDGWGATPPLPLTIGSPSLRWRVTDPAAEVRVLAPDHPLLTAPNRIDPADWDGWVRERGLYFARAWDPAYTSLLAMADPGEAPLTGALLAAPVGRGRHVHVALALHHQWEALVPGAFRLLANLVSRV